MMGQVCTGTKSKCRLCNKTIYSLKQRKSYCGSQLDVGTCAYRMKLITSAKHNKTYRTKEKMAKQKARNATGYDSGIADALTWLNF